MTTTWGRPSGPIPAGWVAAPAGQVLMPGLCHARDADGQGCTHGVVHLGRHQSTGLRAWLDAGPDGGLIRAYEADRADELEAMEAPLLARFDFVPVARQELARTEAAGLSPTWVLFVGIWAPAEHVEIRLRLVCYARPWQVAEVAGPR